MINIDENLVKDMTQHGVGETLATINRVSELAGSGPEKFAIALRIASNTHAAIFYNLCGPTVAKLFGEALSQASHKELISAFLAESLRELCMSAMRQGHGRTALGEMLAATETLRRVIADVEQHGSPEAAVAAAGLTPTSTTTNPMKDLK